MSDAPRPTAEITLLGRHYVIACNPDEERKLDRAARYLDRAMHGIHAQNTLLGTERIAIMAALNITHELLEALEERRHEEHEFDRLGERLDRAVAQVAPPRPAPSE